MSAEVQDINPETGEAEKTRNRKPEWDISKAIDADGAPVKLNEDGNLMGIPQNWDSDYAGLKKTQFAHEWDYFNWKATRVDVEIAQLQAKQKKYREDAEEARNPDPKKQGIRKLQRMQSNVQKLMAQLKEQGIDISQIG